MQAEPSEASPSGQLKLFRRKLQEAMAAGDHGAARQLLAEARPKWLEHPGTRLMEARMLLAENSFPEAEAVCRSVLEMHPAHTTALRLYCQALRGAGRIEEARALFEREIWASEVAPEQKAGLLADLTATGAVEEIEDFIRRLDAARLMEPSELARLAIAEAQLGLPERALERLARINQRQGMSPLQTSQLVRLLVQELRLEEARSWTRSLLARDPGNPEWLLRLAQIEFLEGKSAAAVDHLAQALSIAPSSPPLLKALGHLPMAPERFQVLFEQVETARRQREFGQLSNWHFAIAALRASRTESAIEALGAIEPGSGDFRSTAHALRSLLLARPLADWDAGQRFTPDLRRPLHIVRVAGASATIFVFPGLRNLFGFLPHGYLDRLLADLPANIVYLHDLRQNQAAFLEGVEPLGQGQKAYAASLARIAQELGARRIVTLGSSVGGFAALRYGALLGAQAAISFSGPSKLYATDDRPSAVDRRTGLAFLRRYSERQRDVLPDLQAQPAMTVWHFAGAENVDDLHQQGRLRDLPQARLETVPGVASHNTVTPIAAAGRLPAIVARAIGEEA